MALDLKSIVDSGVDRKKALGGTRRLEPLLFSFSASYRLV